MFGKIYLDVPYEEKEEAKSLGAKWDGKIKKWYFEGAVEEYVKFGKWLVGKLGYALIIHEYLYILEATRICYRCKQQTPIIALGVGEHTVIYLNDDGKYEIETEEDYSSKEALLHLAWVDDEKDIPPTLLDYLKTHYTVKTGYSNIAGKCFANHCCHCGAIQGNNYVMDEIDSPLSNGIPDGEELAERLNQVNIKMFTIDENLNLNWILRYCDNDDLYFKYGNSEKIIISNTNEEYISYQELYKL